MKSHVKVHQFTHWHNTVGVRWLSPISFGQRGPLFDFWQTCILLIVTRVSLTQNENVCVLTNNRLKIDPPFHRSKVWTGFLNYLFCTKIEGTAVTMWLGVVTRWTHFLWLVKSASIDPWTVTQTVVHLLAKLNWALI